MKPVSHKRRITDEFPIRCWVLSFKYFISIIIIIVAHSAARLHETPPQTYSTTSPTFFQRSLLVDDQKSIGMAKARIVTPSVDWDMQTNEEEGDNLMHTNQQQKIHHRWLGLSYNQEPVDQGSESLALHLPNTHILASENDPHLNHPTSPIKVKTTGTTIVGLCIPHLNTVILAADTRATEGTIVADKACEKIHLITDSIYACGAGTSGDLDALLRKVRYNMILRHVQRFHISTSSHHSIEDETTSFRHWMNLHPHRIQHPSSISAVCRLIRNELYDHSSSSSPLGVNLILGGYDSTWNKTMLVAIHPHGSMDVDIPYAALGSGGLAAMGVLESEYRLSNITSVEKGVDIAIKAVKAGIQNDLGSGSSIDLCIIQTPSWNPDSSFSNGVQYIRERVKEEAISTSKHDREIVNMVNQRLIQRDADEDWEQNHSDGRVSPSTVMGNGGFGSVPYMIQRKSLFLMSEEKMHSRKRMWLQQIIHDDASNETMEMRSDE